MRIAILTDYLTAYGGAERVLDAILEVYTDADIYTSQFSPNLFPSSYSSKFIKTSFLNVFIRFKFLRSFFRRLSYFVFLFFNLKKYDLIILNTNGPATWIKKYQHQRFIAYYHKIPGYHFNKNRLNIVAIVFSRLNSFFVRQIDLIITNSKYNQLLFKQVFDLDSVVIYPPVLSQNDIDLQNTVNLNLTPWKSKEYYIFVGRLEEFKGLRYIIEAINLRKLNLVVIGEGELRDELDKYPNVKFFGFVNDEIKFSLLKNAKALINGAIEQYGIVFIESLLCKTPVIAYQEGGASELIQNGVNGILFNKQCTESVVDALERFEGMNNSQFKFNVLDDKTNSTESFVRKIKSIISE